MNEKAAHDLLGPLARAKTIAKLLQKENPEGQWLPDLLEALEELDEKIRALSSSS